MNEPTITVGIQSAKTVEFTLKGIYHTGSEIHDTIITGGHAVSMAPSGLTFVWNGTHHTSLTFTPTAPTKDCFELGGVTIGVQFHWQRRERQRFKGALTLLANNGEITVINTVPVEEYLTSVISSEMSSTSPLELLKAHAVISRSWLMSQIANRRNGTRPARACVSRESDQNAQQSAEIIRWWDHDDHQLFDVCADDHCQRYQGTRRINCDARQAVGSTRGLVITHDGELCDARFSKCCGGMMEIFGSCWDNTEPHPYLQGMRDLIPAAHLPDLTDENNAREWIESTPQSFCGNVSEDVLAVVLNGYDRELKDFYRWKVELTQEEIVTLLRDRSGINVGYVTDLIAVERGRSGRIVRLLIRGTKGEITIGKELMIRRSLSPTHLLSSAFTVEKHFDNVTDGEPSSFTLRGAGWGHGVGLCQIGAASMASQGYSHETILSHYYPGSLLTKMY